MSLTTRGLLDFGTFGFENTIKTTSACCNHVLNGGTNVVLVYDKAIVSRRGITYP